MSIQSVSRVAFALSFCVGGINVAQADTWDGFFVGFNGGMVSSVAKYQTGPNNEAWFAGVNQTSGMWANGAKTERGLDPIGGVSVAYNRQAGAFVYGGEVGLNLMDVDLQHTSSYPYTFGTQYYDQKQKTKARGLFTLKGRAGYAFGNSLLSATAGVAATELHTGLDFEDSYTGNSKYLASHYDRQLRLGWTAGVAYEYMLQNNLVLKAEYQYVDFGKSSFSTPIHTPSNLYITQMNFSSKVYMSTFMIGIEKKF